MIVAERAASTAVDELLAHSNLTPRQLLIYAGQRVRPDVVVYDAIYGVVWPELELPRFRQAWQWLLDSCDALRTVVEEVDGVPLQYVQAPFPFEIEYVDLAGANGDAAALDEYIRRRLRRPLVLQERLFDTAVIHTGAGEHLWFLNVHHVVADAAAVELLVERLHELYARGPESLEALPSFAGQVHSARAVLASPAYRADEQYWRQLLASLPAPAPPFGIVPRSTDQERVVLQLDETIGLQIEALARSVFEGTIAFHAAMFNTFAAAFAMFLARVADVGRVTIGSTFHNRLTATQRRTIGLLMEVLPLALQTRGDDGLAGLMLQAASVTREALRHRTYSVPNSGRAPAYLALINYMRPLRATPPGLQVRRIHPGHGAHALALSIAPPADGHGWQLWLDVNAALAQNLGARRIAEQFRTFLEAAVDEPRRPAASLRLIPEGQRPAIRELCHGPQLPEGLQDRGCHQPFESQVSRTPDAIAVVSEGVSVSYQELNRRANRLAHELMELHGVAIGELVGIHLDRSLEMIVAVLAVLKAGAAYLPLDPAYPATRLQYMIEDALPTIIITSQALASQLSAPGTRLLMVASAGPPQQSDVDPGVRIRREHLAYVMYTSGSTGAPKGVMVTHGGVVNYLAWRNSCFPLTPADRCLQKASLSFDDSVWEILEPLGIGAGIVLARPRFEYDSAYLVELIASQQISAACLVPSLLRNFIEEQLVATCRSLRRLTTGGETLSVTLQQRVLQRLPGVALYNGYGATETTVASVFWRCLTDGEQASVPIGRPIANTQVYVLDDAGELLPPGVSGQLHVGGAGIAAGYLRRPELSAERFIQGAAGAPRERLYRTGDRGRLRADGVFEFLGRADEQVKINGVRVEPGEVEAALLDHPLVRGTAVVCSEGPAGARRLIAYVEAAGRATPNGSELRRFLRGRLPAPLIPAQYVMVESLPKTPSGKLDRNALLVLPERQLPAGPSDCIAPRNDVEVRLLEIWKAALEVRPIGVDDDFFEIGGHSLLAVQLAAEIGRQFHRRLPPGLLFEAPTIDALARRLVARPPAASPSPLVTLRAGSGAPLYCIHHVRGNVNCYRELALSIGTEQAVYGIEIAATDGIHDVAIDRATTIETLAARYVGQIVAHQPTGPYRIAGYSAGGLIAYEMARLLASTGRAVGLLAILDTDAGLYARRALIDPLRFHIEGMARLPLSEAVRYPWRYLRSRRTRRARRSQPAAVSPDPVTAALDLAVADYRPQSYAGPVTLFRATDRRVTGTYARTLGWGALARGGVRVIDIPGDHRTIMQTGPIRLLASRLSECLAH